jgi:hypothetical protein
VAARRAPTGLIQLTWLVDLEGGEKCVAQRMHAVFGEKVLDDMEAITAHLAQVGMTTPRPRRTRDGALFTRDAGGRLWRVLTFLPGMTVDQLAGPAMAREAGRLVARFHGALDGFAHEFQFVRAGVHDTQKHRDRLEAAVAKFGTTPLADELLERSRGLALDGLPTRITHGDLKISNVLYSADEKAVALLDLDTLGRLSLAFELGDALRSWCNPRGESVEETAFSAEIFTAAIEGYASGAPRIDAVEEESVVAGLYTVSVELAIRFCVDFFEDSYFGWDPKHFPSRREHNRVRAVGQLALAKQVEARRAELEKIVATSFRSSRPA